MQIRPRIKTSTPENDFEKSLEPELVSYCNLLAQILNNGLLFSDNFNMDVVDVSDTGVINTEFTVAHERKRVPTGFLVININKAGVVYANGTAWTATSIFLKCSVANATLKLLIF